MCTKGPHWTSNNASYKPKNPEICSEPLSKRGYEVVIHVYHTNQTLGKRDYESVQKHPLQTQLMRVMSKKTRNLLGTTEQKGLWGRFPCIFFFPWFRVLYPEKGSPTQLDNDYTPFMYKKFVYPFTANQTCLSNPFWWIRTKNSIILGCW